MDRRLLSVLAPLLALAAAPSVADAAQRFAAPGASGAEPCNPNPCSIVTAINSAPNGSEVILAPGDYGSAGTPLTTLLVSTAANLDLHGADGQARPRIFGSTPDDTAVLDVKGGGAKARHLEVRQVSGGSRQMAFVFSGAEATDIIARNSAAQGKACTVQVFAVLSDSLCEATGTNAFGVTTWRVQGEAGGSSTTLRNVTAIAMGGGSMGIQAFAFAAAAGNQNLTVSNSIARGAPGNADIGSDEVMGGASSATVSVDHTNFGLQSQLPIGPTGGDFVDNGGNQRFMSVAFVGPGDYHQAAAAITIDAGADSPVFGATDFDGDPRSLGLGGPDIGADEFVPPPIVATGAPAPTTGSTAVVNGTVNANTVATTFHFEFGTTPAYGSSTPDKSGGAGTSDNPVAETLSGLAQSTTYHYRVIATSAGGTSLGADRTVTTGDEDPPGFLGSIALGSKAFAAAASGPSTRSAAKRRRAPIGTTVTFSLDEAATVRFTVERLLPGRRSGRRCVKPTRRNRRARKCTRFVLQRGSFTRTGQAGRTRFRFTGRLNGRKLAIGRYRLAAVATDAAGNRSAVKRASFKIVRR